MGRQSGAIDGRFPGRCPNREERTREQNWTLLPAGKFDRSTQGTSIFFEMARMKDLLLEFEG